MPNRVMLSTPHSSADLTIDAQRRWPANSWYLFGNLSDPVLVETSELLSRGVWFRWQVVGVDLTDSYTLCGEVSRIVALELERDGHTLFAISVDDGSVFVFSLVGMLYGAPFTLLGDDGSELQLPALSLRGSYHGLGPVLVCLSEVEGGECLSRDLMPAYASMEYPEADKSTKIRLGWLLRAMQEHSLVTTHGARERKTVRITSTGRLIAQVFRHLYFPEE